MNIGGDPNDFSRLPKFIRHWRNGMSNKKKAISSGLHPLLPGPFTWLPPQQHETRLCSQASFEVLAPGGFYRLVASKFVQHPVQSNTITGVNGRKDAPKHDMVGYHRIILIHFFRCLSKCIVLQCSCVAIYPYL